MKIDKKSRYILITVGAVAVSVLYYQSLFIPQRARIEELRVEKEEKEKRYEEVMETVRFLEARKSEVKILNQKIIEETASFYPKIIQENLILEIDKLLKDSKLNGSISFSTIDIKEVQFLNGNEEVDLQTSFQPIVDEYNNKFAETEENNEDDLGEVTESVEDKLESVQSQVDDYINSQRPDFDSVAEENGLEDTTGEDLNENSTDYTQSTSSYTTEQMTVSLSFTGNYDAVKKFIEYVNDNSRRIVISDLSIGSGGAGETVSGSMNIEFYAIPKLGEVDKEYFEWLIENNYGKDYPFSIGTESSSNSSSNSSNTNTSGNSTANNNTSENSSSNTKINYDFIMSSKPVSSDLPSSMLGKANDKDNDSYLYYDNKGVEDVEIVLTESEGKYYYKYKLAEKTYPSNYSGKGEEFTTDNEKISIKILSTVRLDEDDKTGLNVKIVNLTNKEVDVYIENDDVDRPRINLTVEGKKVNINNNDSNSTSNNTNDSTSNNLINSKINNKEETTDSESKEEIFIAK